MKKLMVFAILLAFLAFPLTAFGVMGKMAPKSTDINVEWFGSLKTYPSWMSQLNFNDKTDVNDWMLDENGVMSDHNVRNELRIGWKGGNDKFDFLIILEGDFNLDKNNTDRGAQKAGVSYVLGDDQGMDGGDFGIEKLDVGYNFGPFRIHTGWTTRWLDLMTGGLVYGDDHPYIGLTGNIGENFSWEADYTIIYDCTTFAYTKVAKPYSDDLDSDGRDEYVEISRESINPWDGDALDWRVYSIKGKYTIPSGFAKGFVISPFYAFSDNSEEAQDYTKPERQGNNAQVSYFGLQGFGKLGMFTPRFEIVYANGDTDKQKATVNDDPANPDLGPGRYAGKDYDISAMAAYASVDIEISPAFIPYFGVKWEEGDDDPDDDDIDAFNSITDISRYTPTFGMENAIVYRFIPNLGTNLYSGNFNVIGTQPGYGGISNSSRGDAPGLLMWGLGFKGKYGKWSYQVQYMDFEYDEAPKFKFDKTGNRLNVDVDDDVGQEFDLRVAYAFSKHFTIANCFAAFDPGDAIEDYLGNDYDDTALVNTVELIWKW